MGWPVVALGEVVRHRKEFVTIEPDETYSRCRVQTSARGIVGSARPSAGRRHQDQETTGLPGRDEFLVAEIDAKLGGYGIVPDALDGAIVSSHYFLFEVDERYLLRRFLHWYCQDANFLEQVNARGSTNYAAIRPGNVLEVYHSPSTPRRAAPDCRQAGQGGGVGGRAKQGHRSRRARRQRHAVQRLPPDHRRRPLPPHGRSRAPRPPPGGNRPGAKLPRTRRSLLRTRNVSQAGVGWHVGLGSKKLFRIHTGDLLFNIVFAWEGAVAIAQPEDDGRVGSHRFLTCVPDPNTATADFLRFYFLTPEGLSKLGDASPGGAGRNRTLGLKKLDAITVPTPPLDRQRWFDRLQGQVRQVETLRGSAGQEVGALLPAVLHGVFRN